MGCAPSKAPSNQSVATSYDSLTCRENIHYIKVHAPQLTTVLVVQWNHLCVGCETTWVRSPLGANLFLLFTFYFLSFVCLLETAYFTSS